MAKRAPKDEKPFNPIESALVERVASRVQMRDSAAMEGQPGPAATLAVEPIPAQPVIKRPPREKRVLLSWEEELALQRLLDQLTETLQTPVKLSNALRSCLILLRHAQGPIVEAAARQGNLVRPANNDQTGIALFEQRLASIFQGGFTAAGKLD
jgi:hypothetical protein